jgi:cytochrome c553
VTDSVPPSAPAPDNAPGNLKNRVLRWTAIAVGALLAALLLAITVLYVRGRSMMGQTFEVPTQLASVPTDSASLARGEHLSLILGCAFCHGERLEGKFVADAPPALIVAPNLTRGAGGVGSHYSAMDWDKAVRYGVRPDGSPLLPMMPYDTYSRLNDADMAALASYLASRPAVDNQVQPTKLKPFGYIMFGMAGLPRDGLDRPRPIIAPGATPEYGAYLASLTCAGCHGTQLQGQSGHGITTPGLHGYGSADVSVLARALRTGTAADGRQLSEEMPWEAFRHMNDTEISAVHAYLRTLAGRN